MMNTLLLNLPVEVNEEITPDQYENKSAVIA